MKPPTYIEAAERGLLAHDDTDIHTFSNGTQWDCWADSNCYACRWWDKDKAGADCAFECASFLGVVSPALALLFGWTQNPEYATYQGKDDPVPGRHGWSPPDSCRFFRDREDDTDEDGTLRPPPFTDPAQLILIADPTEVIHDIRPAEIRVKVPG